MSRCIACNDILSDNDLIHDDLGEYCLKCNHINLSALQDFYNEEEGQSGWALEEDEDGNK